MDNYKYTNILDVPEHHLTPGMKQYQDAKRANPDCIVMLRMGDFYEMFYQDAIIAAKELDFTLTARGRNDKRAPLAGVPYHAAETYIGKLVKKGYKVAIVEQLEDPKKAKGLVKRGLIRIVTPGTLIESSLLDEKENNFIMAITSYKDKFFVALCDVSTGEFLVSNVEGEQGLIAEIVRYGPSECIMPESLKVNNELINRIKDLNCYNYFLEDYYYSIDKSKSILLEHFESPIDSFGINDMQIRSCGALLHYLITTQKKSLMHINNISVRSNQKTMFLDSSTLRNLELLSNIKDGSIRGSLLSVIDWTVTPMGARLIRKWIKEPLLDLDEINKRLDKISCLKENVILREEIRELLRGVYDLDRLIGRVHYKSANAKDLIAILNSLDKVPIIKSKIDFKSIQDLDDLNNLREKLSKALRDDVPNTVREGGIIRNGYSKELDELRDIQNNGTKYLQNLEEKERRRTGINSLKIGFTRVFGYFIEVTKRNVDLVPGDYIRKQTTANSERYITEELKIEEEKILGAQEKIVELEFDIFMNLLEVVSVKTKEIQKISREFANIDCLQSLAKIALENNYCRPKFVFEDVIQIKNGRHPVVEKLEENFVSNNIVLLQNEMMLITGPNMAGKSTIMRQTALIVLLAQIGSFVPAEEVVLGLVDRIFTRVGAYDDLSSGQSTFMVEMQETAAILNSATDKSLVILDEIGRGTSTFDGVSIAWSVAEYIYNNIKSKTMFATHYHVLNTLGEKFSKIKNYNIAVKDVKGDIIFLRKLIEGGTDQSFGVHVAKLAGLPEIVLKRAKEVQEMLENEDSMKNCLKIRNIINQKKLGEY